MLASIHQVRNFRSARNKALAALLLISLLVVACSQCLPRVAEAAGTPANHLLVSEVFYDTLLSSDEWIEIYNPTASAINLSQYKIGDEETMGGGEAMYQFPDGTQINAGSKIVVALKAISFFDLYGEKPNFEVTETDPDVANMVKYSTWATGSINLGNAGDEVVVLNESDIAVDVVVFEGGSYSGVIPHPGVANGHSLERSPANIDTNDCSVDFIDQAQPNPGAESPAQPPPPPPGGDTQESATKSMPVKVDVVHTLYLTTCELWTDTSTPMPATWPDQHPKNELNLGVASPILSEGVDSFQFYVKSNNEWAESVSWTNFNGTADSDAAGEVIPAARMKVQLNGQEINNNYVSTQYQQIENSKQIKCFFKPDWSDPVGKYVGSITVSVNQN